MGLRERGVGLGPSGGRDRRDRTLGAPAPPAAGASMGGVLPPDSPRPGAPPSLGEPPSLGDPPPAAPAPAALGVASVAEEAGSCACICCATSNCTGTAI